MNRVNRIRVLGATMSIIGIVSFVFAIWVEDSFAETPSSAPTAWRGRVVHVSDGDTATILRPAAKGCWSLQKLRLAGVDAPELRQPYGKTARNYAAAFLYGRTMSVTVTGKDHYGRLVGKLCRGTSSPYRCLSYQLVRKGLAWHYKKYSKDKRLARAESKARKEKVGLWKQTKPLPPWKWRKNRRNR